MNYSTKGVDFRAQGGRVLAVDQDWDRFYAQMSVFDQDRDWFRDLKKESGFVF
jgi:hypothetical protein